MREDYEEMLSHWQDLILNRLSVYRRREDRTRIYYLCPFHKDKNPSFVFVKEKHYFVDYHTSEVFNLKQLGEKLGVDLNESA